MVQNSSIIIWYASGVRLSLASPSAAVVPTKRMIIGTPSQKNATLVRQYFGMIRLDTPEQVKAMNALYEKMWLYYNFFQPVLHLQEKICLQEQEIHHWNQAQKHYQR